MHIRSHANTPTQCVSKRHSRTFGISGLATDLGVKVQTAGRDAALVNHNPK